MSDAAGQSLRDRIRGKWQLPALAVAIVLLAGAVFRFDSVKEPPTLDAKLSQLADRVAEGFYTSAIDYGAQLLERDDIPLKQRGEIHLHLGRAHCLRAERERRTGMAAAEMVQREYATAERMSIVLPVVDLVRLGDTYVWANEPASAVALYSKAVEASDGPAIDIRRRIIELSGRELRLSDAEMFELVDAFVRDATDEIDQLYWAAEMRIDLLAALGRNEESLAFLEEVRPRFTGTRWEDGHEYLVALALHHIGRSDEAEGRLRSLRNRLSGWDTLHAQTGWLLGRVVLSDDGPQRPEEALSFFRDVVASSPGTVFEAAGHLGVGESLAGLERFEESLVAYRRAVELLGQYPHARIISPEVVRASATVVAEGLRREGRVEAPLRYYEIAAGLVDGRDTELTTEYLQILGDLRAALADELRTRVAALPEADEEAAARRTLLLEEVRLLFLESGETFQKLARINILNEDRSAEATWRAADMFDESGDTARTIAVLELFAKERPANELVPRVLLRLGQARQALGLYEEAVEAYRENLIRFPRTPDASSGLIPLARCYMAMGGEESMELAEKILVEHILADSPIFTPLSPEYRDALFLLGELYGGQERFEEGIAVLEEALERYPQDARAERSRFLLADGYRRSALELKEGMRNEAKASEWPRMRTQMNERLQRATELFAGLVGGFEATPDRELDALERMVLKHSRLYQADCLFELQEHVEAVALYETAAFIYRDDPAALAAYVQVINGRISLGQVEEAQAALRRAHYLLQVMPDRAFEGDYVGQSRAEWGEYLGWLERSKLLGNGVATR